MEQKVSKDLQPELQPEKPVEGKQMVTARKATNDLNQKQVREELHTSRSSRGRGRSEAERKQAYAKYRANKKTAIELEAKNKRYLILYPASDADVKKEKFYTMGGISAIIYCHEIGPRIKRKPVLRRDMDNMTEKFHSGVCSIANLNSLTEKLAQIGIKAPTALGDLVIFKLNREYSKDEIKEMLKAEQAKLDSLNKLLYAKVLYPDIHRQIIELKRIIPAKVKNMDKTYREIIGMRMLDSLMELVRYYSLMTHDGADPKKVADKMMLSLGMILEEVSILNELKLWEVSSCIRVASIDVTLRQLLRGKILNK